MNRISALGIRVVIFAFYGCAAQPIRLQPREEAVTIYSSAPPCEYKNLGMVTAETGSTAWGVDGNYQATINILKRAAFKKGANAIIVKHTETSAGSFGGAINTLVGDAIICKEKR